MNVIASCCVCASTGLVCRGSFIYSEMASATGMWLTSHVVQGTLLHHTMMEEKHHCMFSVGKLRPEWILFISKHSSLM